MTTICQYCCECFMQGPETICDHPEDRCEDCEVRAAERYYDNYDGPRGNEAAAELAHQQNEARKLK